ncbi:MAG: hypothetical protein MI867_01280 [Pseudomonadales bacterium]|nr:hypothetical protein [Pseudomonadales bacterium]
MVQPTSVSYTVYGLSRLDTKPSLSQIGRAPASALSTEDETSNLASLSIAQKLLFVENNQESLAINNANKGISFTQTADRALDQTVSAITELRALAVQATADSLSDDDRDDLQAKADKLIKEINEIAATTFDGKALFDGSLDSINFQLGSNASDTLSLVPLRADAVGLGLQQGELQTVSDRAELLQTQQGTQGIQEGDADVGDITEFKIKLENVALSDDINIADVEYGGRIGVIRDTDKLTDQFSDDYGSGIAKSAAERINDIRKQGQIDFKNIFASAETSFSASDIQSGDFSGTVNSAKGVAVKRGSIANGDLVINGFKVGATAFLDDDGSGNLAKAINELQDKTGVSASVSSAGELSLAAADGRDIVVSTSSKDVTNLIFGGNDNRFSDKFSNLRVTGKVTLTSEQDLTFFGAASETLGLNDFSVSGTKKNKSVDSDISTTDFSSVSNANAAITSIDEALGQVRNYKVTLQQAEDQFKATFNSTNLDLNTRSVSKLVSNLTQNLFKNLTSTSLTAQANVDSQSTLFFLRT